VALSIVSDPLDTHFFDYTVRAVGRVTDGLARLSPGDWLGVRGPFGRGWPVDSAEGRDILVVTGGLGCAPVSSLIRYVLRRRERFGRLYILQGVAPLTRIVAHGAPLSLLLWVSTTTLSATVRHLLNLYQPPLIHQIRAYLLSRCSEVVEYFERCTRHGVR
jgi:hypothetical protein